MRSARNSRRTSDKGAPQQQETGDLKRPGQVKSGKASQRRVAENKCDDRDAAKRQAKVDQMAEPAKRSRIVISIVQGISLLGKGPEPHGFYVKVPVQLAPTDWSVLGWECFPDRRRVGQDLVDGFGAVNILCFRVDRLNRFAERPNLRNADRRTVFLHFGQLAIN